MLKINKSTRKMELNDVIYYKGREPFKSFRQKSKNAGFSLIFNTTGKAFAINTLENEWTEENCDSYIRENQLQEKLDRLWQRHESGQMKGTVSYRFCKYWTVATDIKAKFFAQYPKVQEWIDAQIALAKSRGYVTSPFGAIRRLPQLYFIGSDTYNSKVKNLSNIACNTPVQNFEACLMNIVVIEVNRYIRENALRSRVIGMVHDSLVFILHKSEIDDVLGFAKEVFERPRPQNNGVPMELECEVADIDQGEYWGFGHKYEVANRVSA